MNEKELNEELFYWLCGTKRVNYVESEFGVGTKMRLDMLSVDFDMRMTVFEIKTCLKKNDFGQLKTYVLSYKPKYAYFVYEQRKCEMIEDFGYIRYENGNFIIEQESPVIFDLNIPKYLHLRMSPEYKRNKKLVWYNQLWIAFNRDFLKRIGLKTYNDRAEPFLRLNELKFKKERDLYKKTLEGYTNPSRKDSE